MRGYYGTDVPLPGTGTRPRPTARRVTLTSMITGQMISPRRYLTRERHSRSPDAQWRVAAIEAMIASARRGAR